MLPHGSEVSLAGFFHNQIFVTTGNMVGGGVMVGMVYVFSSINPFSSGQRVASRELDPVKLRE